MISQSNPFSSLRIGHGFDVHAFSPYRKLILGGVCIDHYQGLEGHSDADVLTHAIMDALLGAARLGDIGKLFPPTDESYKDADSIHLLKKVASLLNENGFFILDIDSVVIAEKPKISPYREQMRSNLAVAMNIDQEHIGCKATTTEHLGYEGREEGISAQASCLLMKQ